MKKIFIALTILACAITLTACGKNTTTESNGKKGMISVDPLSIEGFNSEYLPDKNNIKQYSGKIDVCLDFEGKQAGWKAVAKEYERLQGGAVTVVINDNLSGSTYSEKLIAELQNPKTDWDIVQGNLAYDQPHYSCIDMRSAMDGMNPYCGVNRTWKSVLDEAAYKHNAQDTSGVTFIMNGEIMQSCWFVNDVALEAAAEKGYVNKDGVAGYPITWDDLMNLCAKMQEAGYAHPLGITLSDNSIKSTQFTWLLRIYGDYYYRQFYKYIMTQDYWSDYDPEEEVPELFTGYSRSVSKVLNVLFDEECKLGSGYIGFRSEVYMDLVSNIAKIKDYLIANVDSTEFNALRDQFRLQSLGTNSAQILLDYQGNGMGYIKNETDSFKIGYFDYPTMESGVYTTGENAGEKIVSEDTITRDIGGNGGFVSIVNHTGNSEQNDLNKDFIRFFLSPYGQTIYYQGLYEADVEPTGLSTVDNSLIVIPKEWTDFFNESNKTVKFNGNCDSDPFITFGVRYFAGYLNTESCIVTNWRNLLMKNVGSGALTVKSFANQWAKACFDDYKLMASKENWDSEAYLHPERTL